MLTGEMVAEDLLDFISCFYRMDDVTASAGPPQVVSLWGARSHIYCVQQLFQGQQLCLGQDYTFTPSLAVG